MRRFPIWSIVAMLAGLAATVWFGVLWEERLPQFEKYYLTTYARTSYLSLGSSFDLLYIGAGRALALPDDPPPYLEHRTVVANHESLKAWLKKNIYDGKDLWEVFEYPLGAGLLTLCLLLLIARKIERRNSGDKLLRGPKVISKWKFWLRGREGMYIETRLR
jgi:hypothetical protein